MNITYDVVTYKLRTKNKSDKPNDWYENTLRGHFSVKADGMRLWVRRTRGDYNPKSEHLIVAAKCIKTKTEYFICEDD